MRAIYFDTETTGLNCRSCKIIELAMVVVDDGVITTEYDEFINIGEALPSKIVSITGITDDMLLSGESEKQVAADLKAYINSADWMIAHNAQFDLSFVYSLLKRHYPFEADAIVENVNWLDTLTVLKDRKDYPHKLIDAVDYYEVEKVNFHRAIDDTKALYHVTQEMMKERNDLRQYRNLFGYNPRYGVDGIKFDFIDYERQPYHNRGLLPEDEILPNK